MLAKGCVGTFVVLAADASGELAQLGVADLVEEDSAERGLRVANPTFCNRCVTAGPDSGARQ